MTLAQRLESMREIAYGWHCGQDSALYSFASTGKVWGDDHRRRILAEIDDCAEYCERAEEDASDLERLARYVDSVTF